MRSVTLRNALRIRPAGGLADDPRGPGGAGAGVGLKEPANADGLVVGEPVSGDGPVGFGEPRSVDGREEFGEPVSVEGPGEFGEPAAPREPVGATRAPPPHGEDGAVRDVLGRLCRAYGSLDGATVEHAVAEALEAFRQARVRAFVPILVERRARAALDAAARRPSPAPRGGKPLSAP